MTTCIRDPIPRFTPHRPALRLPPYPLRPFISHLSRVRLLLPRFRSFRLVPRSRGRYRPTRLLGRGAYGQVCEATVVDPPTASKYGTNEVAVKKVLVPLLSTFVKLLGRSL